MCRYTAHLDDDFDLARYPHRHQPSYAFNGDRLLVDKLAYEFIEPKRWDVVVFRYPNAAWRNYIKRLVGLPGDTIKIQYGDIWIHRDGMPEGEFPIARKPPEKLLAMLQPVFDNDWHARHRAVRLAPAVDRGRRCHELEAGTGRRFCQRRSRRGRAVASLSASHADGRRLGPSQRHPRVAAPLWPGRGADQGRLAGARWRRAPIAAGVEPHLITDFTAYDTSWCSESHWAAQSPPTGYHWVGDLAVACTADLDSDTGVLCVELRRGGRRFDCRIDVATGRATLSIGGDERMRQWRPTAATTVHGRGHHEIMFSNCDNELRLWVDGAVVAFDPVAGNSPDHPTAYRDLENHHPDESDLTPVGIGSAVLGCGSRICA